MEQRWGFLAPWFDKFDREQTKFCLSDRTEDIWGANRRRRLEVSVPWHPLPQLSEWGFHQDDGDVLLESFRRARDALALLAAVEHVDYAAWKFLLARYCGVKLGKEGEALFETEVPVHYFLDIDPRGFDNNRFQDRLDYDLVEFCGVAQWQNVSPGFHEALERIAAFDHELQDDKPGVEIQIPVCVLFRPESFEGDGDASGDAVAKELVAIREAERLISEQWEEYYRQHPKQLVPPRTYRCSFQLEPMVANFYAASLMSGSMRAMEMLIRDGMSFSQVALSLSFFDDLTANTRKFRACFGSFMSRVFDSTRRCRLVNDSVASKHISTADDRQLGAVEIAFDTSTGPAEVAAMFSAMAFTQTTRKITIHWRLTDEDQVPSTEWWKWLAYGLFSKRARAHSAVESLELVGVSIMGSDDIAAFAAIATSDHPEEELFGSAPGLVEERIATLKSEAPIRWEFNSRGKPVRKSHPLVLEEPVPFARTFSDDGESEWVDVLLPGFGRCQVQRDALAFGEGDSELPPRDLHSLVVEFNTMEFIAEYDGFPSFLQIIGAPLRSLVMHDVVNLDAAETEFKQLGEIDSNWVLNSCPNLREASFFTKTDLALSLNFEGYYTTLQPVPELNFMWGDDVKALLVSLADASNPLSTCIRRMRICTTFLDEEEDGSAGLMEALVKTLDVNHYLEYLEFEGGPKYWQYQEALRKYHQQPLRRVREPLSIECKIALLSVMSGRVERTKRLRTGPTLPDLNQSVLQSIFSFAAFPAIRQVYFEQEVEF